MLVLTRKEGEKVFVGNNIVITIIDIERGKIRIGVEAPKDVSIARQELLSPQQQAEIIHNANTNDKKEQS